MPRFLFVRSGRIYPDAHILWSGIDELSWSSLAYSNTLLRGSFNLGFTASGVNPSINSDRYFGISLRCLVR